MKPQVELVSTGSELLSGRTLNRHAGVLGTHLHTVGLLLSRDTTVPDDMEAIEEAVSSALERVDVVIVSGGLGPTSDDVTREALAHMLGRGVVTDEESVLALHEKLRRFGRKIFPTTELQARVVEGAVVLPNSVGAAPGERIELGEKTIFVLPGPPVEFLAVLTEQVLPWLRDIFGPMSPLETRTLMVSGLGESNIVAIFDEHGFPPEGVDVAYSAAPGRIEIRLSSSYQDARMLDETAGLACKLLGDSVFAEEAIGLPEAVGRLLKEQDATLATAESCTGGMLGSRITSVNGSSVYYVGGVITYSNEIKIRELGIDEQLLKRMGAVSEEVARDMAMRVRERFHTDFGISITGIAGPTGGTGEKPVGLVYVGLADKEHHWVRENRFMGDRDRVRHWSTQVALDMLRRRLQGVLKEGSDW